VTDFYRTNEESTWLVFRLDTYVNKQPVDIYMIMDVQSESILSQAITATELSNKQLAHLIQQGKQAADKIPHRIIVEKNDPVELFVQRQAVKLGVKCEIIPKAYLESLIASTKEYFSEQIFSPSCIGYYKNHDETIDEQALACLKLMVPDSYEPCSCASGKKYKFCCKKIFLELMSAMQDYEEGDLSSAIAWINKAKAIVGETAEVLCREYIIYSNWDREKSDAKLKKCLIVNPSHPRAHYLLALNHRSAGQLLEAIKEYKIAITHYPSSDHFHLNEAYNNLGSVYHRLGDLEAAKYAWEKALLYSPQDEMTQKNLDEFIYNRPIKTDTIH